MGVSPEAVVCAPLRYGKCSLIYFIFRNQTCTIGVVADRIRISCGNGKIRYADVEVHIVKRIQRFCGLIHAFCLSVIVSVQVGDKRMFREKLYTPSDDMITGASDDTDNGKMILSVADMHCT